MAPTPANIRFIRRALLAWHHEHGMSAPWRDSADPYQALVAAVMAQQTQMSRVLPSYERFISAFPTVEALAAASLGDVIRVWKGMGYNQRAVRLHRAAWTIVEHGWPDDADGLRRIDGIGPFTAAIVASFAFGQRAACVDTNVVRVLGRLTGDETLRGSRLQQLADDLIPVDEPARWNQALMDYGASVCSSRPKCGECVVSRWCASRDRFAGVLESVGRPTSLVADEQVAYQTHTPRPKFEETPRYFRGRIIDVLRDLPAGHNVTLGVLRSRIARSAREPTPVDVRAWVLALEESGLCILRQGRVSLPV